jgi:epoxyqueuosine reductase
MTTARQIKEYALEIGFCRAGITTADAFPEFIADLQARSDKYDFYVNAPTRPLAGAAPRSVMPSARSIITVAYDYVQNAFPEALLKKVGRLYQARCYLAPPNTTNGARVALMRAFIEKLGMEIGAMRVPERPAAARAGIATVGRNNFAYAAGIGSFIVLTSFVVDKELEPDAPTMEEGCPPGCSACMKACPTQAIYAPHKLDPYRCIGFNQWKRVDGTPDNQTSFIPHDIREKMGGSMHGCDICQEVCPRNRERLNARLPEDPFLSMIAGDITYENLLEMKDGFYEARVRPIMYNYIRENKYFQRNAAIAMGNSGDRAYVPALARAMRDPEPLVREYSAWALGRIGGQAAKRVLEDSLREETAEPIISEIKRALERMG